MVRIYFADANAEYEFVLNFNKPPHAICAMKISLALQSRRSLNRGEAWACLVTNLVLPGSGSLVAGRAVGYGQLVFSFVGLGATLFYGLRFIFWFFKNWARLTRPHEDPFFALHELWLALRWPVLGLAIFAGGMVWALFTSLQIFRAAKNSETLPPRLG